MLDYKELVKARKREEKRARKRYKTTRNKKKYRRWKIIGMITIVLFVLLIGIYLQQRGRNQLQGASDGELIIQKKDQMVIHEGTKKEAENKEQDIQGSIDNISDEEIEQQVNSQIEDMSVERQVAQLLLTTPEELTGIGVAVQAGDTTKMRLKQYPIGGMVYTEQNFQVIEQITTMLENSQLYSTVPLFLIINELGAERIANTNTNLYDVGINMIEKEGEIYLALEKYTDSVAEQLKIVEQSSGSVSELLYEDADMLVITDNFFTTYKNLVNEVSNNQELANTIQNKVKKVMTYKMQYPLR